MEEKERYEWGYNGKVLKHYILDTETNEELGYEEVFDLLNQQDKRIKELEDKDWYEQCIKQLEEQNTRLLQELKDIKNNYRIQIDSLLLVRLNLFKQLKQSQKQLAIEVLEKFKSELVNKISPIQLSYTDYVKQVYDKINNQSKN